MATKYGTTLGDVSATVAPPQRSTCLSCLPLARNGFKLFRNRGAVLVLFMSFCGLCVLHLLDREYFRHKNLLVVGGKRISPAIIFTGSLLLYPVFGWLADVRYGRYKVIKWSLRMTLVALILFCLVSSLFGSVLQRSRKHIQVMVRVIVCTVATLVGGGFQVNVIQFGIDQLTDASSADIASYIRWYVWVWFLSDTVVTFSLSCLCPDYEAVGLLLLVTLVAIAVSLELVFNHWMVKEPTSANPFILIYRVLRYAKKHKHPRLRSAFTYWDDKPYHRIDLAKTMYGGPYTTEQVEDVKTFFRVLSIIIGGAFFTSWYTSMYPVYGKVLHHLFDKDYTHDCVYSFAYMKNCYQRHAVKISGSILIALTISLFEFVIFPYFKRHFQVSILKKMSLGMVLLLLSTASSTAIEFVAQVRVAQANATCSLLDKDKPSTLTLDYKWMIIPFSLNSIAVFIFLTSSFQFLCAQSPYSMKGLLFGFMYGSAGFFAFIGYSVMVLIQWALKNRVPYRYGCLFWYLVISLGILTVILVVLFFVFKCYKGRSRGDSEHNEQIFAVNYYSKCQDSTE